MKYSIVGNLDEYSASQEIFLLPPSPPPPFLKLEETGFSENLKSHIH